MSKIGRPEKELDLKQLETLAGIHCTDEEIAAVLGVSERTLQRRKKREDVQHRIAIGRAKGRASLRRKQWETAQGDGRGATAMQIWLGKQLLGQFESAPKVQEGAVDITTAREKLEQLVERKAQSIAAQDEVLGGTDGPSGA